MKSTKAAVRYAKALFGLAKQDRRVSEVRIELARLAELFDASPELREALWTPLNPAEQRKSVLFAVCEGADVSELVKNFCSYLVDQRRFVAFDLIHEEFDRLADEDAGLTTARVVSASPLDDRRKDRLRRALSERTGREVRLEVEVDSALIGGAIAQVGDLVFDGSLRTQLGQLRSNLMKGS